ncbi:Na+/H+ antiporter NhaC [Natribacillus halophilus]|uniref:Malate + proton/lactate + sodium antiporter, NhaC family n=1 Tax=Natribacillus halophilus TaxID=549003 RepID=A0A1G8R7L7_9BACI|nr:Na+/H+ antiporter NhaC [Natribacillus halophilus]SDJ12949.1 malate + proton/lactate + sodium antiporter, NhaC family [Natribacillus halophilus]
MTTDSTERKIRLPNGLEVLGILLVFIAIMFLSLAVFDIPIQMALILAWTAIILFGLYLGHNYYSMQDGIQEGISRGLEATLILITVGAIIGTWILGGVVPTLIYYGINMIHPVIFLFAAMVVCAITSLCTGTSFGTAGTAGVAMIAVGQSFGIPLPLVAGAVISGAYVGDKLSPLSDTTVLVSSLTKVDIVEHIRSMLFVSLPAFVIASILFIIVGIFYVGGTVDMSQAQETMFALEEFFNIQWYMLIPAMIVVALLAMRKPPIPTIAFGALLGAIWAVLFQGRSIYDSFMALYEGYAVETGYLIIDELLNTGGIEFMLDVILLILLALGLGGLMEKTGILQTLTNMLASWANSTGKLSLSTMLTAFFGNFFGGAAYVSSITGSKITEKNYEHMNVDKRILARNTEAGGTVMTPLVPWTDGGVYMAAVLGVSTMSYLSFAWFNILVVIISLIYGFTGWFIWRTGEQSNESIPVESDKDVTS